MIWLAKLVARDERCVEPNMAIAAAAPPVLFTAGLPPSHRSTDTAIAAVHIPPCGASTID